MELHLSAMSLVQGKKLNYVTSLSFKQLETFVSLCDVEEKTIEQKYQRPINSKRVVALGNYIYKNRDTNYGFTMPPLIFGINSEALSYKGNGAGTLKLDLERCKVLIHDGQHRVKGILKALKTAKLNNHEIYKDLASSQVAIQFEVDPDLKHAQQIFADINGHSKPSNPSINMFFEQREEIKQITKEVWLNVPIFHRFTEIEKGVLPDNKIWQYSTICGVNKTILQGHKKLSFVQKVDLLQTFWLAVSQNMPYWNELLQISDDESVLQPTIDNYRKNSIVLTALLIYSLGTIAHNLLKTHYPSRWGELCQILQPLQSINWTRNNHDFQEFCIFGKKVVSNKKSRDTLAKYIAQYINLD